MTDTQQSNETTKSPIKAEPKEVKTATKTSEKPAKPIAAKKANKEEMMQKHQQMIQFIQNMLGNMENDMKRIKLTLNQLTKFDPENPESVEYKDAEQMM
jgi:hypothetical protein